MLVDEGHEVVGATMKLWGGASDSGCCSASDVQDARRVADQLKIDHYVFNFTDEFTDAVLEPYASDHAAGRTPNPCVECNRHLKFSTLLDRADRLGFDAVATGHHARVEIEGTGSVSATRANLRRGRDRAKDQSYVVSILEHSVLDRVMFPVGEQTKDWVREQARLRGLVTAAKADSQDVCFIASRKSGETSGRHAFLGDRIELHPGRVLDTSTGEHVGEVPAVELVTVGQRRGLGIAGGPRRFAVAVDVPGSTVWVAREDELLVENVELEQRTWTDVPLPDGTPCTVQSSAHGEARPATMTSTGVHFAKPSRKVAPGQLVALYDGDRVLGSGVAR